MNLIDLESGFIVKVNDIYYGFYIGTNLATDPAEFAIAIKSQSVEAVKELYPYNSILDFNSTCISKRIKEIIINETYNND